MPEAPRRWVDDSDDELADLAEPEYEPAAAARRLSRLAVLAVAGLLAAAAGAVWSVLTYAGRDAGDTVVHHPHPAAAGAKPSPETSSYTIHFLLQAYLPIVLSALVCAAPFILWHRAVDRAARELGAGLDSPDWAPLGGWFVPVFNLKVPIVSIRELALVHGSDLAGLASLGWWGSGVLGFGIDAIMLNAQHHSKDLEAIDRSAMVAGFSLAASALLAVVVVVGLTRAAKARLESVT